MVKKLFKYAVPYRLKKYLKYIFYALWDFLDVITGKRNKKYPPRRLNFIGSYDFERVGLEFKKLFHELGGLKPDDHVLDIGCGIGRMAIQITEDLEKGSYLGFDIVKTGVEWCQKHVTARYPNFRFVHANVRNQFYNEKGTIKSEEYRFPADQGTSTFCFATSVFTHMLPEEVEHYLEETSRVMKKGGRIFFTFFLIPDDAQKNYQTHCINFQYLHKNMALYSHKDCIEAEVGYHEKWVKNLLEKNGFTHLKIYPGKWKDPDKGVSYQDIIVATRG